MHLIRCCLAVLLLLVGSVSCGLKFVAFKGPFGGFAGIKYHKPRLFKHHGLGFGHGGFGGHGGGFHSSGYEHHEWSHHSGGFGGWLGK